MRIKIAYHDPFCILQQVMAGLDPAIHINLS